MDLGLYDPALGDLIWVDTDRDGLQDAGEPGVPGVLVNLYIDSNGNGLWDPSDILYKTTTTDANGNYLFTFLPPADYIVQIDATNFQPSGALYTYHLTLGGADPDNDDNSDSNGRDDGNGGVVTLPVTITSGGEPTNDGDGDEFTNLSVDFGFWHPTAALGNYVWLDSDKDGVQDDTESGIAGVVVTLYDSNNTVIATTTTDSNGHYLFSNLLPGAYFVQFTLPTGYNFSPLGSDPAADTDSNADPVTGRTVVTILVDGETDLTWDAGIYPTPTSLGDENEPTAPMPYHIFLPQVTRTGNN